MTKKAQKAAAAHARASRHKTHLPPIENSPIDLDETSDTNNMDDMDGECGYEGGVNCYWSDDSDYESDSDSDWSDGEESVVEFEGEELEANLKELRAEIEVLRQPTGYEEVSAASKMSMKDWQKVESNRALGYTGNSLRTAQRNAKAARNRERNRAVAKIS